MTACILLCATSARAQQPPTLLPPVAPVGPASPDADGRDTPGPGVVPAALPPADGRFDQRLINWFGLRPALADRGVTVDFSLTADYSKNLRGGLDTHADVFRHLFDARIDLDTDKAFGWQGGTLSVDFQNQAGRNGGDAFGTADDFDNIDADGRTQISELWYEQKLADDKFSVKIGKVDANTEFGAPEYTAEFINSNFAYSPTTTGLPTYPDPAVSLNLAFQPTDWLYVNYGIYDDGNGESTGNHAINTLWRGEADFFHVAEAGVRWTLADGTLPGRFAAGASYANGRFERFRGGEQNGTASFYCLAEQKLLHTAGQAKDGRRGVYAFAMFGAGDEEVNDVRQHLAAGLLWVGPYPATLSDTCGIGCTRVFFTDADGSPYTRDSETSIEAFYNVQATTYLSIKPDLQYVIDPGGVAGRKDALIATLRVTVAF